MPALAQLIVSTQSVALVSAFEPEDVVVVEYQDKQSIFRRLAAEPLQEWLAEYSLGELWGEKRHRPAMIRINIICEGPTEEAFVNKILIPHFQRKGILITPRNIGTGNQYKKLRENLVGMVEK